MITHCDKEEGIRSQLIKIKEGGSGSKRIIAGI